MAQELSPTSVKRRLSTLRRIIRFAEAHNHVERNVATLIDPPRGKGEGRPSRAFTLEQVHALLEASQGKPIGAYIALSAFTGIRTEEARPLERRHLHLNPVPGQKSVAWRPKTGRSPVDRGRPGSKHQLITDANGIPLAVTLTGGNRNDGVTRNRV